MAVKPDRKNFMFTDKKEETLIKKKGELNGLNFKIRNLQNCTVYLLDHTNGLFIDDCINCKIIVAPCDGSVMIRTSKNCSISIVAKQLRFRDCENIQIFSYIESEPVVESCSEIHFGPYNAYLPAQEELFTKANFTPKKNTFHLVYDFTEKVNTERVHWNVINGNIDKDVVKIDGIEEPVQGLYPDYEEEFDFYVNNGHLPYDINKVVIEGENIPIDTTLNKKTDNEIKPPVLDSNTNNEINIQNNIEVNNQPILQQNNNDFFDDNIIVNSVNTNLPNTQINNNINDFFASNNPNDPFSGNLNPTQSYTNQNQTEDIEITNSYNYANPNPVNEEVFNIQTNFNVSNNNFDYGISDPEEFEAEKRRKVEEHNRIKQIMEKQMKEQNTKREIKNKAREYLENFNQKRVRANEMRHRTNTEEEKVFLDSRENAKQSTKNPWDRVVSLIDLKESEYKGSKNIDRMRQCIISRRYDFSKNLDHTK